MYFHKEKILKKGMSTKYGRGLTGEEEALTGPMGGGGSWERGDAELSLDERYHAPHHLLGPASGALHPSAPPRLLTDATSLLLGLAQLSQISSIGSS